MIDLEKIPLDDDKTFRLLRTGKTKGCFQLESRLGQEWTKRLKPEKFEHIPDLTSILRPSCLESGTAESYVKRKNGLEEITYEVPELEKSLKDTYGVGIQQEQAISICQDLAGFTEVEGDLLRVAVGKKLADKMSELKPKFIDGCKKHSNIEKDQAEKIFEFIEKGQRYSFSKLHAYAYGILTYYTAYLKAHYPDEFFCGYLVFSKGKPNPLEEIRELIDDSRHFSVNVLPPKLSLLNEDFVIEKKGVIRYGLSHIKGIGDSSLKELKKAKNSTQSWKNFLLWCPKLNKRVYEALIKSGSCDYFDISRKRMIEELSLCFGDKDRAHISPAYKPLTKKELPVLMESWSVDGDLIKALESIIDQKACTTKRIDAIKEKIEKAKRSKNLFDSNAYKATNEQFYLGTALTCSAADDFKDRNHQPLARLLDEPMINEQYCCVVIEELKKRKTAKGDEYVVVDISDNSAGQKWVKIWPRNWNPVKDKLHVGAVCELKLKTDYWKGRRQFNADSINVF